MIKAKIIDSYQSYNELYIEHKLGFMQSWEWGEVKKPNWIPYRFEINNYPISLLTKSITLLQRRFGYVPRGLGSLELGDDFYKSLDIFSTQELKLTHLILEPDTGNSEKLGQLEKLGWKSTGYTIQPQNTNIISLDTSEENIFARMSGNYRWKIRRAIKHGCSVEVLSFNDNKNAVSRFFVFMDQIYHRTKFVMFGQAYFEKIWKQFGPADLVKILVVRHEGKDIGSMLYVYDSTGAYELYGGTGDAGRSIMANYILKWEGIKLAIKLGKVIYDQWGVAPSKDGEYDLNHPLARISEFKSGFGGHDFEYLPQQTRIYNPLLYNIYKFGFSLNKLSLVIKKL